MEHLEETFDLSEDPQGKVSSGGHWLSSRKISGAWLRVNYDVVGRDEMPGENENRRPRGDIFRAGTDFRRLGNGASKQLRRDEG